MQSLKELLAKLYHNINILLEREAKFGGDASLSLVNQIEDYRTAIALTKQAIAGDMSEAELTEQLAPLNLDLPGVVGACRITIEGDQIIVGDIQAESSAIAVGTGATASVTIIHNYAPTETRSPYQAPALPPHFVERVEIGRVKVVLLTADAPTLALTALHGMGGIGKTTLAAAVAHEQEIIEYFKDGILWASLGPNGLVENWQVTWGRALGDDLRTYPDPATKATRLRELLAHKTCLMVIDDAWPETDLPDLLVGGPACRTLITTRQGKVAQQIGAQMMPVGVLREDEALALLGSWAGWQTPSPILPLAGMAVERTGGEGQPLTQTQLALELVRRLGHLPLAVTLAGAQLLDGASLAEILIPFQAQQGDLSSLDLENPRRKGESLKLCFDLSVQRLDEADHHRFAQLGVFAANAPFDEAAAKTV